MNPAHVEQLREARDECAGLTFQGGDAFSIQETFKRLRPLRLDIAHARMVTLEDLLLVALECKRILKAIDGKYVDRALRSLEALTSPRFMLAGLRQPDPVCAEHRLLL